MKRLRYLVISIISFLLAAIYALPNVAIILGVALAVYNKWVSAVFCLIFAYNVARLVESYYVRYLQKEGEGRGFHFKTVDEEIHFTFVIKDHDGRQLDRLKFMREKFFKDEH